MEMSWHELFRLWATFFLVALSSGWTIFWTLRTTRRSAAKDEQDKLAIEISSLKEAISKDEKSDRAEFTEVKNRLQKVEADIQHLPTKDQIHKIDMAMGEMKADVRELSANIRPLASSVERIDNFLMERARA